MSRPQHDTDGVWHDVQAWPSAKLGEPLGGGSMNHVREVTVAGRRCVARVSRRTTDDLDWEIRLLDRLAAAGLDVPRLVPTATDGLRSGRVVVMEWVDGAMPDGTDDWRRVAGYLRRLHELTSGCTTQRPGWRTCVELVTATRSGPVDMTVLPPQVLARCRAAWARLHDAPCGVVHGDPSPPNIRINGERVVFLDWDEARVDSTVLDFAYVPDADSPLPAADHHAGRQAFYAWECAMFWTISPEHAQRRLAKLDQ